MSDSVKDLDHALEAAAQMRTDGRDPDAVGHWLLTRQARCEDLEKLLRLAERYVVFGQPEQELAEMERLIERLREQEFAASEGQDLRAALPL